MRRSSASLPKDSGTYTSPGTPEYGDNNMGGNPQGWCSERVPLGTTNNSRKHINAAALTPFYSGRALPSKWDDAERWITSPVSVPYGGVTKNSSVVQHHHRRPKSKSGPLGPPGVMYLYSPPMMALEGGAVRNFMADSPFTTGVLLPDGVSLQYGTYMGAKSSSLNPENCVDRSYKVAQSSDLLSECESSLPSSQDDKPDGAKEAESNVSRVVSRRDMATQMSPDGSIRSSPESRSASSTFPAPIPSSTGENSSNKSAKVEVRDVQVDKGTAVATQYKKQASRKIQRGLPEPPWDVRQAARNTSKLQREEAEIAAWENLQKAKAEAAIRKLEIKIEKRRSKSMDKILKKLRVAQLKAQEMRRSITESNASQRTSKKVGFFGSLTTCFFCRAL